MTLWRTTRQRLLLVLLCVGAPCGAAKALNELKAWPLPQNEDTPLPGRPAPSLDEPRCRPWLGTHLHYSACAKAIRDIPRLEPGRDTVLRWAKAGYVSRSKEQVVTVPVTYPRGTYNV